MGFPVGQPREFRFKTFGEKVWHVRHNKIFFSNAPNIENRGWYFQQTSYNVEQDNVISLVYYFVLYHKPSIPNSMKSTKIKIKNSSYVSCSMSGKIICSTELHRQFMQWSMTTQRRLLSSYVHFKMVLYRGCNTPDRDV